MSYRDYRYEPTIDTQGSEPEGWGLLLVILIFAALAYGVDQII